MEILEVSEKEAKRFWNLVCEGSEDECWTLKSRVGKPDKYTTFKRDSGKTTGAHRIAYASRERPFPTHLTIDHLCKVRACLNPKHLEPVTYLENNMRSSRVQKTHCKFGHDYSGDNIYVSPRGERSCKRCRRERERAYQDKLISQRHERGLYKRYSEGESAIGHNRRDNQSN